jgi:hypothetical protein
MSSNLTSFRLPSAYAIPAYIEHEGKKIPLPSQIRDNIRMVFNGLLDAHQAIVSLNEKVGAAGAKTTINNVTNVSGGATLPVISTAGQGYMISAGIFQPIESIVRTIGSSWCNNPNVVFCIQFNLPIAISISKISIYVQAVALGHFAGFGVYSADGNTLWIDSGPMSVASAGIVTTTLSAQVQLLAGVTYIWAQTADTTTASLTTCSSLSANDAALMNANASFPRISTAANASVAGQLPSSLGALTAVTPATVFDMALVMMEP